jgi:hypothetical protein
MSYLPSVAGMGKQKQVQFLVCGAIFCLPTPIVIISVRKVEDSLFEGVLY